MKKLALVALAAFVAPMIANAVDTMDGCGLGWDITDKKTLSATTTRGTTNYFVPPSFGMTSGTINCEQLPFAKNDVEAATYAYTNFDALKWEMAVGEGETLEAFGKSLGCEGNFGQIVRENYDSIYTTPETTAREMFYNTKAAIAGQCS